MYEIPLNVHCLFFGLAYRIFDLLYILRPEPSDKNTKTERQTVGTK